MRMSQFDQLLCVAFELGLDHEVMVAFHHFKDDCNMESIRTQYGNQVCDSFLEWRNEEENVDQSCR